MSEIRYNSRWIVKVILQLSTQENAEMVVKSSYTQSYPLIHISVDNCIYIIEKRKNVLHMRNRCFDKKSVKTY